MGPYIIIEFLHTHTKAQSFTIKNNSTTLRAIYEHQFPIHILLTGVLNDSKEYSFIYVMFIYN